MEKQPKRRILSLSLSQPGKHQKKTSRLKRHVSATSEDESNLLQSKQVNERRDANSSNSLSRSISQPMFSNPPEIITPCSSSGTGANNIDERDVELTTHKTSCHANCQTSSKGASQICGGSKNSSSTFQSVLCESDVAGKSCIVSNSVNDVANFLAEDPDPKTFSVEGSDIDHNTSDSSKKSLNPEASSKSIPEVSLVDDEKETPLFSHTSSLSKCADVEATTSERENKPGRSTISAKLVDSPLKEETKSSNQKEKPDVSMSSVEKNLEILQCPLCYRTFEKLATKTSHLKGCASKHKLSTQQLLDALELQQRQAQERRALGLPGVPSIGGSTKKNQGFKKESRSVSKMDSGLQLAMALSLSLQDQKSHVGCSSEIESSKGISLDHFGFSSKPVLDAVQPRPLSSVSSSNRGKAQFSKKPIPTLLTRTIEERQQIITEKVAMILLEEVDSKEEAVSQLVNLQSAFLQEHQDKDTLLWKKSYLSPTKEDKESYYVKNLQDFISPSKVKAGSKLMHLSQIVGRVKTPTKLSKQEEVKDVHSVSPSDDDLSSDSSSHKHEHSANPSHIEMELRAKLFNDWAGMVNNYSMSDLAVYPQEGREIPAHKIIFQVRCPHILRDISKQRNLLTGNEVEVIMWSKTPHAAALAFLEYVYCGSVKSIRALSSDLSSINWLAHHYKIADLLRYLKSVAESVQCSETPSQVALNAVHDQNKISYSQDTLEKDKSSKESKENEVVFVDLKNSVSEVQGVPETSVKGDDILISPSGTPPRSSSESIYSEVTLQGAENCSPCSSPDMFCDDDFEDPEGNILKNGSADNQVIVLENHSSLLPEPNSTSKDDMNRPSSQCASISSDKTVLVESNLHPPSPSSSNSSTLTEILDKNQEKCDLSHGESKRKLSNSSCEGSLASFKRRCSASPTPKPQDVERDNVELLDLTQDTDSNTSLPMTLKNFSGDSPGRTTDLSDNENCERKNNSISESAKTKPFFHSKCSEAGNSFVGSNDTCPNRELRSGYLKSPDKSPEPYVSPVWDGFEDMNFDDPFFTPPLESPCKDRKSPPALEATSVSPPSHVKKNDGVRRSQEFRSFETPAKELEPKDGVSETPSPPNVSPLEALLDDSFCVNDSILRQAESEVPKVLSQRETKGTPVNRVLSAVTDNVTPLANYSIMESPELKRELQKFGLKPSLGKRKGKIMLRHIYDKLHPWVPAESDDNLGITSLSQPTCSSKIGRSDMSCSQPINSRKLTFSRASTSGSDTTERLVNNNTKHDSETDESSSSSGSSFHEVQLLEDDHNELESLSQGPSQSASGASLATVVFDFITNDRKLHQKVLEYEPIWIDQLQIDLRNNGHKFKMNDLMAFLDEKCITFRTAQSGSRVKKSKKSHCKSRKKPNRETESNDLSE